MIDKENKIVITNEEISKAKINIDGELIEVVDELSFDISCGDKKFHVYSYAVDIPESDMYSVRVYNKSVEGHTDELGNAYYDSCGISSNDRVGTGYKEIDRAIEDYLFSPRIGHIIAF